MAILDDKDSNPHCADTVPAPSVMDSIPLELAAMIMENLLEYDLVWDLSSEYRGPDMD